MLLTTVRHVGVLGTFLPPAEPVPLVISDFVRSAVARRSVPNRAGGLSVSGGKPVPLVISDFGDFFAVACLGRARARAHVRLFRYYFSFRGCGVPCRKRARTCARAAFLALCLAFSLHRFSDEIARAHSHKRLFGHLFLVPCLLQ